MSHTAAPTGHRAGNTPAAIRDAVEQFALACEILDELVRDGEGVGEAEQRPGIVSVLGAIGIREPRAVAAAVARDALNRTAEASAELPDALADVVLEDVVRTARLIDTATRLQ